MTYRRISRLLWILALVAICCGFDSKVQQHKIPIVRHADFPLYPPLAWSTNTSGTVVVLVTLTKGAVTSAEITKACDNCLDLEQGALENAKSWVFADWITDPITIVYDFTIGKKMKNDEVSTTVQVGNSIHIIIEAAPSKPTTLY